MRSLLRSLFVCLAAVIVLPPAMPEHPQLNAPRVPLAAEVATPGLLVLPLAALPAGTDPSYLHIRRRGTELPVQIDGDSIQFVAAANDSPYTHVATYWLSQEPTPGLRAPLPLLLAAPLGWERDTLYQPVALSERGDRWFAGELRAGAAPLSIALTLTQALPAGAAIELHLAPLVRRAGHHVQIWSQGTRVGAAVWDDGALAGPRTIPVVLTHPLPAGPANLELTLASAGAPDDVVLLDRLGLPGVRVPLPMLPTPALRPAAAHDLRAGPAPGQPGASFLIVTHAALRPALGPLIAAHQRLGDTVAVVDVQDVYDTFSYGERDPEAIRSLIRAALAGWQPAPRALLLVGAGSVRMRGAPDPTFIPPYLLDADPKYGEIPCDSCYARVAPNLRDQPVPSIPVGRLPAHTLAEAHTLVAKTVSALLQPPAGTWRGRALALADNAFEPDGTPDPAGDFAAVAERALAQLPALRAERFYYAPEQPTAPPFYRQPDALRRAFFGAFDQGAALVLYVGHGSIWQWAFTNPTAASPYLVSVYDAGVRTNGARLPLLLSMDCLSGNWANPTEPALDELLLLAGNGGVAAALTPAGSGVNSGHAQLLAGALPLLVAGQTLGAAQLAGLAAIARSGRDSDLLFSFGILGDPAVRLPAVQDTLYLPFAAYRAPRP